EQSAAGTAARGGGANPAEVSGSLREAERENPLTRLHLGIRAALASHQGRSRAGATHLYPFSHRQGKTVAQQRRFGALKGALEWVAWPRSAVRFLRTQSGRRSSLPCVSSKQRAPASA